MHHAHQKKATEKNGKADMDEKFVRIYLWKSPHNGDADHANSKLSDKKMVLRIVKEECREHGQRQWKNNAYEDGKAAKWKKYFICFHGFLVYDFGIFVIVH